jgi:acetoin utilization deacetylase AcuC-like enzyme
MSRLVYSPRYFADLGTHVMPIRKFGLVAQDLADAGHRIDPPERASDEDLLRVHTPEYVAAVDSGAPRSMAESQKFPWSPELAEAVRWTNGGCITALRFALEEGIAGNLASGFHHAHADHGEGFCTFNGLMVALERLRVEGRVRRALILDMDLHYGNGTASLLPSRPWVCQLSIFGNGYDGNRAYRDAMERVPPDTDNAWSVPVPMGTGREGYLERLSAALPGAIARAKPEVIVYQAGADPYREDPYSPLDLGLDDLGERDRMVFATAAAQGIPVCWVLAGGYTPDVSKVVAVHVQTAEVAARTLIGPRTQPAPPPPDPGSDRVLGRREGPAR